MKETLTVLGARPQFIKASVVSAAIAASSRLEEIVVHTGQHFDANMSDVFFSELGMAAPIHHLGVCSGGHGDMTGRMLIALERLLLQEQPDLVLVYGDTNSTLAGALAAVKLHIPIAHVEAGLRSHYTAMPEEINRILTDRISRWLFTPTEAASDNLRREGMPEENICRAGDVMVDVARHYGEQVPADGGVLRRLRFDFDVAPRGYCLATVHRAENTDDGARLSVIVQALRALSKQVRVVWPLHPRTRAALTSAGLLDALQPDVILLPPVGYLDMMQLEKQAALIATDSGGVQKEAYFYRVPCVTLRDETEWTELVDTGWNRLAPPHDTGRVVEALRQALGSKGQEGALYGNSDAAERIVEKLEADIG